MMRNIQTKKPGFYRDAESSDGESAKSDSETAKSESEFAKADDGNNADLNDKCVKSVQNSIDALEFSQTIVKNAKLSISSARQVINIT